MGAQRLAQPHRRGGFPFAERCRRDGCHHDVLSVGSVFQAVADREAHLGFILSVKFQLVRQDAYFGGNFVDRNRCRCLRNVDVARNACKYILQLMRHSLSSLYLVKIDYGIQTRGR